MRRKEFVLCLLPLLFTIFFMGGCQKTYYDTMEKFGVHKRDIMVDRVENARDSQEKAKEQFQSALQQFSQVLNYQGGELEDKYNSLKAEYERSQARAEEVSDRIDAVENVSEALFDEWKEELNQYSSETLRQDSERKMVQTRVQYVKLITAMRRAEGKMEPVLSAFKDQVLYLKHNLNAQAIASLQGEFMNIESNIAVLIKEMEKSIGEANAFIKTLHE
jgi:Protein of unknown function (DUF2959)